MKHHITIDDDTMAVLKRATITKDSVKLPPERLGPNLYRRANKVLEAAGGKWNTKAQAHLFARDPRAVLGLALENGAVLNKKQATQAFYTPQALAVEMVQRAGIEPRDTVLEPSAGMGALVSEILIAARPESVTAVELDSEVAAALTNRFAAITVHCADFLTLNEELSNFDRILMNPPFTDGQDIAHIRYAFAKLAPGGRLVALCANGSRQNEHLKPWVEKLGGEWHELPSGSFKESGTNVRAAMIVLDNAQ